MVKVKSILDPQRVAQAKRVCNPMDTLTPTSLKRALNAFEAGRLAEASILWDRMQKADDDCVVACNKRKGSVARHDWHIDLLDADDPVAAKHAEALKHFYDNLHVTNAVNLDRTGGVTLLVKQMMDAVCKSASVHEVVWKRKLGQPLGAELIFTPLQFFESTTGRLRFLEQDYAYGVGTALKDGEWLRHCDDGLMYAASICIMFKRFSLQDWLVFSERFGADIPHASTTAEPGSPDWEATVQAVMALAAGQACVHGDGTVIDTLKPGAAGGMPYEAMVNHMGRSIHAMFRGADLATQSSGNNGASVQADEVDVLEDDDAAAISSTLNTQLDRWVIQMMFGEAPRAKFELMANVNEDVKMALETDKDLLELGVEQDPADLCERYGRKMREGKPEKGNLKPEKGNLKPETGDLKPETGNLKTEELEESVNQAREAGEETAMQLLSIAVATDLQPVVERLVEILDDTDTPIDKALKAFAETELPALEEQLKENPQAALAFKALFKEAMQ